MREEERRRATSGMDGETRISRDCDPGSRGRRGGEAGARRRGHEVFTLSFFFFFLIALARLFLRHKTESFGGIRALSGTKGAAEVEDAWCGVTRRGGYAEQSSRQ